MNIQLAALDIYTIVYELQDLIGSYIDKIYQLSPDEVLIRVNNRTTKQKDTLYAHSNGVFFRTQQSFETPTKPTTFAMTLRKHITNGRITEITQHGFDRIIKISIQKKESFSLLFELIPNGNMMLIGQDQKIIMPLKHQHWSQRSIRSKTVYQPPASQVNPFSITKEEVCTFLKNSDADLVRSLAVKLSLGGKYAEEICTLIDIPKSTLASDLSDEQCDQIYTRLKRFLYRFENYQFSPVIIDSETKKDVTPFPFTIHKDEQIESVSSFSDGIQRLYTPHKTEEEPPKINKKKEKLIRQKKQQEKAISGFDIKIQQKKHQGDIIYLHYTTIEQLITEIQENRKLFSKDELEKELKGKELIKEFSSDSPFLILQLTDEHSKVVDITIDYRKSVTENAERLYDESKKSLQKKQGAIAALEQTKKLIEKFNHQEEKQLQHQIKQDRQKQDAQKQFWFEQYRWCIASNGNLILGGKDAKSNDQLIKKHLENGDRYAHADIHGAASCIIKNKDLENNITSITDDALEETCTFAACYSRSWKQYVESQAYWVLPEQVSKTAQSGEFVPKGAFIIRGKRNYCTCKMQLGIGRMKIQDTTKIMGGPTSAIKKWCDTYVIIEPGTNKSSTIAKEIAEYLDSNPSTVQQVLPPGESNIVSTTLNK